MWADGTDRTDANAGTAQLKHIDVRDDRTTASYAITPDQGLNITGRYPNKNKTGITFIMLGTEPERQKFRQVLDEARSRAKK